MSDTEVGACILALLIVCVTIYEVIELWKER